MISYYGALAHSLLPAGSHQDVSCGPGLVRNAVNSSSQLGLCGKYYGSALQRICILLEPHSHFARGLLHVGLAPSEDDLCHNWTSTRSRAHKRKNETQLNTVYTLERQTSQACVRMICSAKAPHLSGSLLLMQSHPIACCTGTQVR